MAVPTQTQLYQLALTALAPEEAKAAIDVLRIEPSLAQVGETEVSRAIFAMALNVVLFADLLRRAPTGAAYVEDVRSAGGEVVFDHGALRTIRFPHGPTGELPDGCAAYARILEPLGYEMAGVYPLDRLGMTGRAYAHSDLPEAIPQFFVSELHVERFSPTFQQAAARVFGGARDNLDDSAFVLLDWMSGLGRAPFALAADALPVIAAAFSRRHPEPTVEDYDLLLAESKEAAWIATEGCAFNHATDRVANVDELAQLQRKLGRPIKDCVEVSASGRVRQTAFRADPVLRIFRQGDGTVQMRVPGSFYEFITRLPLPSDGGSERLDLAFDSSNAQGIFRMTALDA